MPPTRAALSLGQIAPILRDLGLGEAVALSELTSGGNGSFRVELQDGTALVFKTYDDFIENIPDREVYASRLLADLDIPVTRHLAIDESRTKLPFRFAVTNYLPGEPVSAFLTQPDSADLFRQTGRLLRRLHDVGLPGFGHFDRHGIIDPMPDNLTYMRRLAASAFERFRHYGGDAALADRLEAIVAAGHAIFADCPGAVFAHDDLHPNNVLAERNGAGRLCLTGLIDFGNARAASAVFDLAKTLFVCEHEAPGFSASILGGYGPIDHAHPSEALWLNTLIHRVVMWWWLRHAGFIAENEKHPLVADLKQMADEGVGGSS